VRRRWIPHRDLIGPRFRFSRRRQRQRRTLTRNRRRKRGWSDWLDIPDPSGCLDVDSIIVILAIIIAVPLFVFVGWPLVLLLGDLLWLVAVGLVGIIGRVIFRRPWRVEATTSGGHRYVWNVVGFRRAGQVRDDVRAQLAVGAQVFADEYLPPPPSTH
jgi:hypothetical protein